MKTMPKYFVSEKAAVEFISIVLRAMLDASGLKPAAKLRVLRMLAEDLAKGKMPLLDQLEAEFGHGKTTVTEEEFEASRKMHAERQAAQLRMENSTCVSAIVQKEQLRWFREFLRRHKFPVTRSGRAQSGYRCYEFAVPFPRMDARWHAAYRELFEGGIKMIGDLD